MPLHRLTSITVGVPNLEETAAYYTDFGLTPLGGNAFDTADGGKQFKLTRAPQRRLIEIGIGADNPDDLDRIERQLHALDLPVERTGHDTLVTEEPIAGFRAVVSVAPQIAQDPAPPTPYNGPGRIDRANRRAPGIVREGPVAPRKLGHVVIGSTDQAATQRFFTEGIGFKVSDVVPSIAAFMRCSTDHHNVLVQQAPVNFLHHTSWQVQDVDEIGRGAMAMLEENPERHVWGLGRHHVGSNFFWYLKDPAGNFSEYYSDLDCIVDDTLWDPGVWEGPKGLYNWGPPPPPSFLMPEDLATMMTGAHEAG
jgi:catechol 2,3-dioxygenase-like lactoylglutathione lyase family enzyme